MRAFKQSHRHVIQASIITRFFFFFVLASFLQMVRAPWKSSSRAPN